MNCGGFLNSFHNKVSPKTLAKIMLLLLGCAFVSVSINTAAFAIVEDSIKVGSSASLENSASILPEMEGYRLSFLYRDIHYEKIAGQDAALMYAYSPSNYSKPMLFVSINVANSLSNIHSWEVCLISWQTIQGRNPLVKVLDSKDVQLIEEPSIIARYLAFKTPQNYTQLILYWFERAPFDTGITIEHKYVRISLITIIYENSPDPMELEGELLTFGRKIASYWRHLKTQSLISLGVSALQVLLFLLVILAFLLKTSQHIYEIRRRQRNLKIFRGFASKEDKLILKTVSDIAKENKNIETGEIADALRKKGNT